jgi:hypothetical protein
MFLVLAVSTVWSASVANAQTTSIGGKAEAGRTFALQACTGCHLVVPDQPFMPIYTGPPRPPDFREIANQSSTTPASLRHHLQTLPAVPKDFHMANPLLSGQEVRDVVAFIISLRDKPAGSAQ